MHLFTTEYAGRFDAGCVDWGHRDPLDNRPGGPHASGRTVLQVALRSVQLRRLPPPVRAAVAPAAGEG